MSDLGRDEALARLRGALSECDSLRETILALRKEVESVRDLLTKASGMRIGPAQGGHRIAIYFEDYNEAGKLFAILSDRAALATEAE